MNIVLVDNLELGEQHISQLKQLGEVTIYRGVTDDEQEIIERIINAELITASWVYITEEIIKRSPTLKYIVVPAVGSDRIDISAATAAGIKVINCPTHNAAAVAEYTLGLMLAVTRRIVEANRDLNKGNWNPERYTGTELRGKQLTLIGYGSSGRLVASLAQGFGMQVRHANSQTPPHQLDELIASADMISLHLPLTPQSRHLIDARRLKLMKKGTYLINTSRGAIVDQKALLGALQNRDIAGAALDVYENEPVAGNPTPEMMQLLQLDNVVATPHIAYNTEEMTIRLGEELIANIEACLAGNPVNVVNCR